MRYLFNTGLIGAITAGYALLKGTRETPATWRAVLAWISWGITFALAIGALVDMRREEKGIAVAADSPLAPAQSKRLQKQAKRLEKQLKAAQKR